MKDFKENVPRFSTLTKTNKDLRSLTEEEQSKEPVKATEEEQKVERSHTTVNSKEKSKEEYVALRTIPVVLKNGHKRRIVNALLDDASTKTYLNGDVAAELGLQGIPQKVTVNVLNNQVDTFETTPVKLELESLDGKVNMEISAFTADRVTGDMKAINWRKYAKEWTHLKGIQFPSLAPRDIVDMLIGIDYADLHYSHCDIGGRPSEPIARLTPLGWTCIGDPHSVSLYPTTQFVRSYFIQEKREIDSTSEILKKFWEIEQIPREADINMSCEDKIALQKVKSSLRWDGKRYEVEIPWKVNKKDLPNNYQMALNRLHNTEKRLLKDPKVATVYGQTIKEYLQKGYMRKVDPKEFKQASWYLPHFPIIRNDKTTTKVRIVFDAAAKAGGLCLNDAIYQGPKLQQDLCAVLLRFRKKPIALVCDIAEMYLRIGLAPQDRPYHRILWRNLDQTKRPDVYEMNSLVFGNNAAPFEAQFVSQEHARRHVIEAPMAAETVLKSTYMDDSMDSVDDDEQGTKLFEELSWLWGKAGMHARKWLSNSETVLQNIPIEDRANTVDLSKEVLPTVKTLGVMWIAKDDMFTFKGEAPDETYQFTKRNFLKKIATLFDPLGFLTPYTIRAKILLQDIWLSGTDWDERMDENQRCNAEKWFAELEHLSKIQIRRCLQPRGKVLSFTLHTFVDASENAYGAVVYSRCEFERWRSFM